MLHNINILIHVISGTIALIIGVIPFVSKKGGNLHRKAGRIFLAVISITILTALNGVLFFRNRPFLMMLTFFALYQSVSGFRAIKYKTNGPSVVDLIIALVMGIAVITFTIHLQSLNIVWNKALVYYLVGYFFLFLFYDLLRVVKIIKGDRLWLAEHVIKMTGAFSALFQAAIGTVCTFWEPYTQLISASLGSTMLLVVIVLYFTRWQRRYQYQ